MDPRCSKCGKPVPFLIQPVMVNGKLSDCGHVCTNPDCETNAKSKKANEKRENNSAAPKGPNAFQKFLAKSKEMLRSKKKKS